MDDEPDEDAPMPVEFWEQVRRGEEQPPIGGDPRAANAFQDAIEPVDIRPGAVNMAKKKKVKRAAERVHPNRRIFQQFEEEDR